MGLWKDQQHQQTYRLARRKEHSNYCNEDWKKGHHYRSYRDKSVISAIKLYANNLSRWNGKRLRRIQVTETPQEEMENLNRPITNADTELVIIITIINFL